MVPFTRIGAHAYIGGCSKILHDIPPFVLVDGNPAAAHAINVVGLRRAGMKLADRRLLQDAFRLLYRSGLATPRAVERIRQELPVTGPVAELLDFIAGSRRGICGPAQPGTSSVDATPGPESEPVGWRCERGRSAGCGPASWVPATWASTTCSRTPSCGTSTWSASSTSTASAPSRSRPTTTRRR